LTSGAAKFSPVRLSLDDVPERERVGVYREVLGRQMMRMDVAPLPGTPLLIDLMFTALPGLRIVSGLVGATRNARTSDLVDSSTDDFSLSIVEGGARQTVSKGREIVTQSGQAQLTAPDQVFVTTTAGSTRILRLQVPRAALAGVIGSPDDLTMRPIPGDSQPLRLLRRYLAMIEDEEVLATPELRHATVAHIHDLIVLTMGANRDGAVLAGERGMAAARLHSVKADIIETLGQLEITVESIAARHAISPRHVQRLFEAEGTTFSAFVLTQRLARAHRMVSDPRQVDSSIAAVAFDCGFGDLSHFNRTFRRCYQATPSDVRASARASWAEEAAAQ
jgi:AraC-like DNA-binding protein